MYLCKNNYGGFFPDGYFVSAWYGVQYGISKNIFIVLNSCRIRFSLSTFPEREMRKICFQMRRLINILPVLFVWVFFSCGVQHEMAYVHDAERDSAQQILSTYINTIHTGDQLYIYVYSQMAESVVPFNQKSHVYAMEMSRVNSAGHANRVSQMSETYNRERSRLVEGYLVDDYGYIIFPILGKMKVDGITYDSLQNLIQNRLINEDYVKDPVVTVSPMNFRVSVLGEVRSPKELHVTGNRLTILEALARCGDITMYGLRDNVVVIREKNGVATPIEVDLTKKTLFDSEVYYLQQNDIVYVEPNKLKRSKAEDGIRVRPYARLTSSILHLMHRSFVRYVLDRRGLFHER